MDALAAVRGTDRSRARSCALNFPVSLNPGLARTIGTLMKLDFQRAVLNRIPRMEKHPERHWREVLFLCDEYQSFATVGEYDPTGDEKFFALSRQAKCIPIVATQSISSLRSTLPGESWRTLAADFSDQDLSCTLGRLQRRDRQPALRQGRNAETQLLSFGKRPGRRRERPHRQGDIAQGKLEHQQELQHPHASDLRTQGVHRAQERSVHRLGLRRSESTGRRATAI